MKPKIILCNAQPGGNKGAEAMVTNFIENLGPDFEFLIEVSIVDNYLENYQKNLRLEAFN